MTDLDVRTATPFPLRQWVTACVVAETIGMTAAATAARTADTVVPDPTGTRQVVLVVALVVLGGLVEGLALGVLQGRVLARAFPPARALDWVAVTVLVAGVGWAAGSAPAAVSGDPAGGEPALVLVLLGALAIGLGMGATLGAGQALVLRRAVRHPWRWVGVSTTAWAVTMPVIYLGASLPSASWPTPLVVCLGALTGAAAGSALGLVSGHLLPSVDGPPVSSRVATALLRVPVRPPLGGVLVVLQVRGRRTGRLVELPVQYATAGSTLVAVPARAGTKTWWRNLRGGAPVRVLVRGRWHEGTGTVLEPPAPSYAMAVAAYERRWPRARLRDGQPVVRIDLDR